MRRQTLSTAGIPESRDDGRRQPLNKQDLQKIRRVHAQLDAEKEKLAEEVAQRGKYKIQVWFKTLRSTWKPMAFTISIWESGKRLHGGGDEMMFFCKRQPDAPKLKARPFALVSGKTPENAEGCQGLIPGDLISGTSVICPHCGLHWDTTHIGDAVYYFATAQKAAEVLEFWWLKLGCNADLYLKHSATDPRTIMMSKAYSAKTARERKGLVIYPLRNIIKDSAAGASVQLLFKNVITA